MSGAQLVMARPGGHQDSGYLVDAVIEHEIYCAATGAHDVAHVAFRKKHSALPDLSANVLRRRGVNSRFAAALA